MRVVFSANGADSIEAGGVALRGLGVGKSGKRRPKTGKPFGVNSSIDSSPGALERSVKGAKQTFFWPPSGTPFSRRKPGVIHRHRRPTTPPFYFTSRERLGILRHAKRESTVPNRKAQTETTNNTTNTMSVRVIPFAETPFVALSTQCVAGATALGAELDLQTNNAATVSADQYDYVGAPGTDPAPAWKRGTLNQKRQALQVAQAIRRNAINAGRSYNERAVDHLKGYLGRSWNNRWVAAGFTSGSLQLPNDPKSLLLEFRA